MTSGTPPVFQSSEATAAPKVSPASATPGTPGVSCFQGNGCGSAARVAQALSAAGEQPGGTRPRFASDGLTKTAHDQIVATVPGDVGDRESGTEAVAVLSRGVGDTARVGSGPGHGYVDGPADRAGCTGSGGGDGGCTG